MVIPVTGSPLALYNTTHPAAPLTQADLDAGLKKVREGVDRIDAINAQAPHRVALAEQEELEQLERRFRGYKSAFDCKAQWDSKVAAHDEDLRNLKGELARLQKVAEQPLPNYEARLLQKAIARYQSMIEAVEEARRLTIKKAGAGIRSALELAKLRPRLDELRAKAKAADDAGKQAKEVLKSGGVMVVDRLPREGRRSYGDAPDST